MSVRLSNAIAARSLCGPLSPRPKHRFWSKTFPARLRLTKTVIPISRSDTLRSVHPNYDREPLRNHHLRPNPPHHARRLGGRAPAWTPRDSIDRPRSPGAPMDPRGSRGCHMGSAHADRRRSVLGRLRLRSRQLRRQAPRGHLARYGGSSHRRFVGFVVASVGMDRWPVTGRHSRRMERRTPLERGR